MISLPHSRQITSLALAVISVQLAAVLATGNKGTSPAIDNVDGGYVCSIQLPEPRYRILERAW